MAQQTNDAGPAPLLPFNPDGIPESLKAIPRWAPWVAVWNAKRGKYDKVPKRIDNITVGISTAKPETWYTYKAALRCYLANPGAFAGLGYVVTGVKDLTATDIDNCITNGVIADWAQDIVDDLATYTEISPSGNGIRLFNTGTLDTDFQNHDVGLEVYAGNDARFLTVSGQHIESTPTEVNAAPGGVFLAMKAQYAKVQVKATVIDLNMPELLDELSLPTIDSLDVPYKVRDFLLSGDCVGDRSALLHASGIALYSAGLTDAEVFSTLCLSDAAMAVALDHRGHDQERALMYLWREQCLKAKPKAESRKGFTEADFDDISPEDKAPGQGAGPSGTGANGVPKAAKRFTFLQAAQYMQSVRKLTWFVRNVLPRAELGVVYGESGAGKSFLALDLVASIARGVSWRDRKVKQGNVAYICAEGASGFGLRLEAYGDHHGVDMATIPLHVLGDAPNFLEVKDVKDVISALKDLGTLDIIVVDTMAQVTPGANENSGEDMGRALSHCKAIHKATGAMVLLVAHAGKDTSRGIRGWSGIKGALDVEINVERSDQYRAATISKMKDGQGEGDEYAFTLDTVVLGQDEEGDNITSCVLKHTATVARARRVEPKGTNEKVLLRVAIGLTDLPGAVTTNALLSAAMNEIPAPEAGKKDRRREVLMRALNSLVAEERISVAGGEVHVL